MIKKLQHRFIFITMSCISFIFALILLVLNISVNYSARQQGFGILYQYEQRMQSHQKTPQNQQLPSIKDADFPRINKPDNHWFNDMRISYVIYDSDGNIEELSAGGNPEMTEETLTTMAESVLGKTRNTGSQSGYLYLLSNDANRTSIYFLDYSPEKDMSMRLFTLCLWVGLAGIIFILILVIFLSRWVTMPVRLAFEKQKQFVADASHELKTPLTIITANAEVLESSLSWNKWLGNILEQSGRMKKLINNLLDLARLDSGSQSQDFANFDLSRTVKNVCLSFESLAYEYRKTLLIEVDPALTLHGNEAAIKQLVTILLDNAFKYSDEKGTICVRLSSHGEKRELLVHNTGLGISAEDQKRIFERFYRSDASRSRESGGYGLGLSIAEAIVKTHKGHICVKSDGQTYTDFFVTLPSP